MWKKLIILFTNSIFCSFYLLFMMLNVSFCCHMQFNIHFVIFFEKNLFSFIQTWTKLIQAITSSLFASMMHIQFWVTSRHVESMIFGFCTLNELLQWRSHMLQMLVLSLVTGLWMLLYSFYTFYTLYTLTRFFTVSILNSYIAVVLQCITYAVTQNFICLEIVMFDNTWTDGVEWKVSSLVVKV